MFTVIKRLEEKEFNAVFKAPMRFIDENEESSGVKLKKYVQKVIQREKLETTIKDIEIHYVYHSSDEKYEHILFNYGIRDLYAAIIINLRSKQVIGYHILDMIEKYNLGENS